MQRRGRAALHALCVLIVLALGFTPALQARAQSTPLLIGWWSHTGGERNLATYQSVGANVVELFVYPPHWHPTDAFLASAKQHHLQVILSFMGWPRLKLIRQTVLRYRNDTTIWGWQTVDEPDFLGIPASALLPAYRLIKSLDPQRPVVLNFMSGHCHFDGNKGNLDPRYLQTFDVLSIDHYVLFRGMYEFEDLGKEQAYYDRCVQDARQYHKLGVIIILQGFGGIHARVLTYRDPTLREEQYMAWMAKRAGAMGMIFFADSRADRLVFSNVNTVIKANSSL